MVIGASLGSFKGLTFEDATKLYLKLFDGFNLNAVEIRFLQKKVEDHRYGLGKWITSLLIF